MGLGQDVEYCSILYIYLLSGKIPLIFCPHSLLMTKNILIYSSNTANNSNNSLQELPFSRLLYGNHEKTATYYF
jgi:hypothetical protein